MLYNPMASLPGSVSAYTQERQDTKEISDSDRISATSPRQLHRHKVPLMPAIATDLRTLITGLTSYSVTEGSVHLF